LSGSPREICLNFSQTCKPIFLGNESLTIMEYMHSTHETLHHISVLHPENSWIVLTLRNAKKSRESNTA